jgi:hypothetical protein
MLNLTPHKITLMDKDGKIINFLPAGKVVRVTFANKEIDNPHLPVKTVVSQFKELDGIPPANPENPFLVSSMVLDYLGPEYHNIAFSPDTGPVATRDSDGNVAYTPVLKTVTKK